MSTSYATLRRNLAQRLNFWGGDLNGSATTSATSGQSTLIDTTRPEPDDEWDSSWIVLNPGSTDQTNSPTIWRRVADDNGWVSSTGTANIIGTWPSPYSSGVPAGTSYELYKVFRPENWLQAVNYSLAKSYPKRHRAVGPELPQDKATRIIDYGMLAKQRTAISDPSLAPVVTELSNGLGAFQPGSYSLKYTYFNDFGETLSSPIATITIAGVNSMISIASLTGVPSGALGANFYCSLQPNDATVDLLDIQQATLNASPVGINIPGGGAYQPGQNLNGTVYSLSFYSPNPWFGTVPPSINTTNADFFRLHRIEKRMNPGGVPEIYNEVSGNEYKTLGGNKILLMYVPISQFSLKFVCSTQVPLLSAETDSTDEPSELIYAGGEWYLWDLLTKTSTIVNTNWATLSKNAQSSFREFCDLYAMDVPRDQKYRPLIRNQY